MRVTRTIWFWTSSIASYHHIPQKQERNENVMKKKIARHALLVQGIPQRNEVADRQGVKKICVTISR